MNPNHPTPEHIEDEASVWASRLRGGGMTDADRNRLEGWLAGDPRRRNVLARYHDLIATLDLGFSEQLRREVRRRRRRIWATWGGLAAAAAAIVVLFLSISRVETYSTGIAERRTIATSDGSRIELNAQTNVAVRMGRRERRVEIVRGEALFSVAPSTARPFVVDTPAGSVRVTGTVFDVRAASGEPVEITVLEGHVQVRAAAARAGAATLDAGARGVIKDHAVAVHAIGATAAREATAWRDGQVVFENFPLRAAMARFAPYEARPIEVSDAVAGLRIGGRYSLDDLDGALGLLERMLPVRVVRDPQRIRILPAAH